jgi:hypothetical protein
MPVCVSAVVVGHGKIDSLYAESMLADLKRACRYESRLARPTFRLAGRWKTRIARFQRYGGGDGWMFALIRSNQFFLSLFICRFSFRVSLAFFCTSFLRLSFFPDSLMFVSPLPSCIRRYKRQRIDVFDSVWTLGSGDHILRRFARKGFHVHPAHARIPAEMRKGWGDSLPLSRHECPDPAYSFSSVSSRLLRFFLASALAPFSLFARASPLGV